MGVTKVGKGSLVETIGGCGDCFVSRGFKVWNFFLNTIIKISVFVLDVLYVSSRISVAIHRRVFKEQSLNGLQHFAQR